MSINSQVNDFVVRFANVNGTGSASANFLFTKAIFRMGIPVTPKNIFPSNIQGLPTWYEVRVSEKGYLGRREGVDIMVAINAQSMVKDVQEVKSGGYLIYDSTKQLSEDLIREDIHYIGIPMIQLCMENYADSRQHMLLKNVIYVGALAALVNIDVEILEQLIQEQFKKKEKLIIGNGNRTKSVLDDWFSTTQTTPQTTDNITNTIKEKPISKKPDLFVGKPLQKSDVQKTLEASKKPIIIPKK